MLPQYGRELLLEFVPGSARPSAEPRGLALMSMQVLAEIKDQLSGPLLEVTYPGPALLRGLFSAAKQEDAALTVALFAEATGAGLQKRVDEVLQAAMMAGYDRPLSLLLRTGRLTGLDDGELDRVGEKLFPWIDAGFTSISLPPLDIEIDRLARFAQVVEPVWDHGLGVEVELDGHHPEAALFLLELDERGFPLAGVRGVGEGDETCGGFIVADPLQGHIPEDEPARVVFDGFLMKATMGVLGAGEVQSFLEQSDGDVGAAMQKMRQVLAEADADDVLEARAYATSVTAIRRLGADGVATEILDALARAMFQHG